MKYYKHIDGLRAIAVISVIFFHLDISWVKSGFLGVDIFFVISGFLITSIIIRDLDKGTFSLKNFYLRRMRRILPALITVLIVSTFLAWLILLPQDLKNYAKSLVAALGSFSNLFFFKTVSFGYFSTDATVIPLLHTWSLGVEEQFYIFWPLFLIFAFNIYIGIGWKDKQALNSYDKFIIVSVVLFILSLFCFRYFSYFHIYDYFNHQKFYYFPLTRAFELLFGCILAIHLTKNKPINNRFILEILSISSIVLMLYPVLFKTIPYPSNWTVIACVGAILYIYAGCNEKHNTLVNRVLSTKPIVFIGLISYSLYLWHWPIIAYLNYLSIEKTYFVKVIVLFVSIALATLSYSFVEKPFRYKFKASFKKTFMFLWIIPIIIVCCFALGTKYINHFGFNKSVGDYIVDNYGFIQTTYKTNVSGYSIYCPYNKSSNEFDCPKNTKDVDVILFGDSHAGMENNMLAIWSKQLKLSLANLSVSDLYMNNKIYNKNIDSYIQNILNKYHPKIFVFAGWWKSYTSIYSNNLDKIEEAIKTVIKNKVQPVFVLDIPALYSVNLTCGANTLSQKFNFLGIKCSNSLSFIIKEQQKSLEWIDALKKKYPEIIFIDPKKIICKNNVCKNTINNKIIYENNNINKRVGAYIAHLNRYGSEKVGKLYLKEYGNPLKLK